MSAPAIHTTDLSREFGKIKALNALSIDVPAGVIFGFLGPNGAGKTTTINLLLGLLEPTGGSARVMGFDTRTQADEIRARTGALLEHSGVYEHLSAEDNLEFYGRVWRMPAGEREARIRELLSQMGLWERRKERAGKWSRGMKQKLALARALLHHPPLVLLDEPTAGLDVIAAAEIREDLEELTQAHGVTVFLTTHNMVEAERLCSQVAVIREGRLLAMGHPDDLRARMAGPQIEIVGKGFSGEVLDQLRKRPEVNATRQENGHLTIDLRKETEIAQLVSLMVSGGVQVEEVRKGVASLEDVFLTLMEEAEPSRPAESLAVTE